MRALLIMVLVVFNSYSQCDYIVKNFDEMKNETVIRSTKSNNNFSILTGNIKRNYDLQCNVYFKEGKRTNIIVFSGYGSTSMIGTKGLYIKLSNGEIKRYEDMSISSRYLGSNIYSYTCIISVSDEELITYRDNAITNFDLSIYKFQIKDKFSAEFQKTVGCIISKI